MKRWSVEITSRAKKQLGEITDGWVREGLRAYFRRLEHDPELQGKPLLNELTGYRSVRALGQRYRIIYKIEAERVVVVIVAMGIRKAGDKKDIYRLAQRLARLGVLDI
ncbi:MAG: type II toxin-antitoxin system RelE/ParE family toxin [Ktedonobacteraceae bacterium]